ncbi:glycoside hydrolase family 10 protein [Chamaesiphon sp.]|uniref:glycoside hydrolase family 10 protein n=1 Tax=Chamaesiphon sp. TaxID=2814140 RepID=UPI0035944B40
MLKAVWLTNVDSQVMNAHANLAEGLQRLAALGFNTIYPAVWQRGYTLYPSAVAQELTGASVLPNSPFEGRDLLAEIIELAEPLAMRVIPWFEYGLMVPPQSALARQYPDLLSCDKSGNLQRNVNGKPDPQVWLNPCHDRVQRFIADLIVDVVDRYPVTGIQLDDHFAFPVELGYDRFTQQLFQQDRCADVNWNDWRAGQLTALLTDIVSSLKSIRRDCIVSISPNPLSFSKSRYLVDWQQWAELGLIDELVLQVYRDRLDIFSHELTKPEVRAIQTKIPTLIGILTGLKTRPIATETIAQQVAMIGAKGFGGYACFFYETLFDRQLSPILVSRNQQQLIEIFRDRQLTIDNCDSIG